MHGITEDKPGSAKFRSWALVSEGRRAHSRLTRYSQRESLEIFVAPARVSEKSKLDSTTMSRHFILLLHLPERSTHSKTAGAELVVRRQRGRKARTVGSRISRQTWAKRIVQGLEGSSNMSWVTVFQSTAWGIYCISEDRRLNLFNSPSLYIKLCVCMCVCSIMLSWGHKESDITKWLSTHSTCIPCILKVDCIFQLYLHETGKIN